MSAYVFPPFQRRTFAWCEECQDGIRTTKAKAQEWADKHNADRHKMPNFTHADLCLGCPQCTNELEPK